MSFGTINDLLIIDSFEEEFSAIRDLSTIDSCFVNTFSCLKKEFPKLSDIDLIHIINLLCLCYTKRGQDEIDLVVTAPASFNLHTKLTDNVVGDLLNNAQSSITITGYSISDYINDYLDKIIEKSQKGIFVKIFINDIESQSNIDKLLRYRSKFLEIYNYKKTEDKMSALHAKVISIDGEKTLVSSANLSFHGMSGNIELGCRVVSKRIAKELNDLLKQLVFDKIFYKI